MLATNWSGPTAFLSEDVGYPIPIDSLEEVTEGPFRGHLWSSPSVPDLRRLMRHVATHKAEAAAKGRWVSSQHLLCLRFATCLVRPIGSPCSLLTLGESGLSA